MSLSSLLDGLPSRGTLTDPQGVVVLQPPSHVCAYDTSPPEDQVIKTDPTNILIRSLMSKRSSREGNQKSPVTAGSKDPKGKRPVQSVSPPIAENSGKRERREGGSSEEPLPQTSGSSRGLPRVSKSELEGYTVEKLRQFLKERGLPNRGRKEELLVRAKKLYGYK